MDNLFDDLSRWLARTVTRRSAVRTFLATLVMGETCFSPTGAGGCGCQSGYACCVKANKCCDPDYPHYCANTNKCYMYFTQAQDACGNSYEICGVPV